jgi:uncharacterized protein (TIGR02452 family)
MNRSARTTLAKETLKILEAGSYRTASGQMIWLEPEQTHAIQSTHIYTPADFPDVLPVPPANYTGETTIEVTGETALEAAQRVAGEGETNPFCLNFASAKNPGGGFLGGAQAQEESLARSSGLYPCLLQYQEAMYDFHRRLPTCLYSDTMIYSPQVPVFRNDDGTLLDAPYLVSFLTSPAVNAGAIRRNEPYNIPQIEPIMRARAAKLLWGATQYHHNTLILGAWGCGVFGNDPALVARLFAEHLREGGHFAGQFQRIVFAVYDRSPEQARRNAFLSEFG